jgi:hypothetical protein
MVPFAIVLFFLLAIAYFAFALSIPAFYPSLDLPIVEITLTTVTQNNGLGGISFVNPVTNFNGVVNNASVRNLMSVEVSLS